MNQKYENCSTDQRYWTKKLKIRVFYIIYVYIIYYTKTMRNFNDAPQSPTLGYAKVGSYKYQQNDVLGYGFESVVYKGKHITKKFQVAIKAVNTRNLKEGINKIHFQNQIKCLQILKCTPNILNLLDKIQTKDTVYLVTQLCQGDLSDEISKKLTEKQVWGYMKQLVKGFIHLWKQNIIHRDIKPKNLFLNARKEIKIGDFGFAIKECQLQKQKLYNVGSPAYMSPQAFRYNQYSHSSDVWAIGVIFYQMLTGQLPWKSQTQQQLDSRLNDKWIQGCISKSKFGQKAKDLLSRLLRVYPDERISAQQLIQFFNEKKIEQMQLNVRKQNNTKVQNKQTEIQEPIEISSPLWTYKKTMARQKNKDKPSGFNLTLNTITMSPEKTEKKNNLSAKKSETTMASKRNSTHDLMSIKDESPVQRNKKSTAIFSPVFDRKKKPTINTQDMIKVFKVKASKDSTDLNCIVMYLINLVQEVYDQFMRINEYNKDNVLNQHFPLLKVSYKNFIIRTLLEIVDLKPKSKLVSQFCSTQQIKIYISNDQYEDTRESCNSLIEKVKQNQQISVYWLKAKQNNFLGLLNATVSFIEALKPLLSDNSQQELKLGFHGSLIAKRVAVYLSSSVKDVKNESQAKSPSLKSKIKVNQKIQEAIKSRKQLFD